MELIKIQKGFIATYNNSFGLLYQNLPLNIVLEQNLNLTKNDLKQFSFTLTNVTLHQPYWDQNNNCLKSKVTYTKEDQEYDTQLIYVKTLNTKNKPSSPPTKNIENSVIKNISVFPKQIKIFTLESKTQELSNCIKTNAFVWHKEK